MKSRFALSVSIAALLFGRAVLACSMALTGPPQVRLDANEWVFAGQVTGYVGPFTASGVEGEFWALQVAVTEAAYRPTRASIVDVIVLGLASDCSTVGGSWVGLESVYPVGSGVMVVAWPTQLVQRRGRPLLEVSWARGTVSETQLSAHAAISRVANYEQIWCLDPMERYEKGYGPDTRIVDVFEYHKELARLDRASRSERIRILQRLTWASVWFREIAVEHIGGGAKTEELVKLWVVRRRGGA